MTCRVLVQGTIFGEQEYGGVSRYSAQLLNRVSRLCPDIKATVLLPGASHSAILDLSSVDCIRGYDQNGTRLSKALAVSRALARRADIFHATYYGNPEWYRGRYVVTVYDFIYEEYPSFFPKDDVRFMTERKRQLIEKADAVIAISECTRGKILEYTQVTPARVRVICPGVDEGFLRPKPSDDEISAFRKKHRLDLPYWLYVGSRSRYKNFACLLKAFLSLPRCDDSAVVAVGGEDTLPAWQLEWLVNGKAEKRVQLLSLTDEELRVAYGGALALVVPSLAEGFGLPVIEAMACGTPVLAADIPVFREIAKDSISYFDPHDTGALADLMRMTLESPSSRTSQAKAEERARQFSWDVGARRLGDTYREVVGV